MFLSSRLMICRPHLSSFAVATVLLVFSVSSTRPAIGKQVEQVEPSGVSVVDGSAAAAASQAVAVDAVQDVLTPLQQAEAALLSAQAALSVAELDLVEKTESRDGFQAFLDSAVDHPLHQAWTDRDLVYRQNAVDSASG